MTYGGEIIGHMELNLLWNHPCETKTISNRARQL